MSDPADRSPASTLALADAIRAVATAASQDPTVVLDELAGRAESLLGCDGASIHLAETREGEVVFRRLRVSALGRASGLMPDSTWPADPLVLAALRGGQVDFHERFQADHSDDVRVLPWLREVASALYAPLVAAGEPLGLLFAAWRTPRHPDPALLADADALAGCAAMAVRTARLLAEAQRTSAELERLVASAADAARLDGAIKTARVVAHELNNQLSPIRGYSEVLAEMLEGEPATLAERILRGAEASASTVARLQRIIRFEETETAGFPMLDLDAATTPP
ncbi:MAG TPA: GAF domain-containing protein [Chloroflexota bacterium]